MPRSKTAATSFRLSPECAALLHWMEQNRGMNRTVAVEAGVRMLAEALGGPPSEKTPKNQKEGG